jgi:hypothetical protein
MDPLDTEVVEAAPGRLRLHVPGLWRDPARADAIHGALDNHPHVRAVQVGLLSGRVTVEFDPAESGAVLRELEGLFPGIGLADLNLETALTIENPEAIASGQPARPTRDQARSRASTKRKGVAAAGATLTGIIAGLVLRKLLQRK